MALITKKDRNEKELKSICNEQLEVFLQNDTKDFIDKLFRCIKYKDYLERQQRSRSRDRGSRRSRSRDRSGHRSRDRGGDRRGRHSPRSSRRSRSRSPRSRRSRDRGSPIDTRRAQSVERTSSGSKKEKKQACNNYYEKGYCLEVFY